jgi:hypothetical protein
MYPPAASSGALPALDQSTGRMADQLLCLPRRPSSLEFRFGREFPNG